jgi:hypothetical protein
LISNFFIPISRQEFDNEPRLQKLCQTVRDELMAWANEVVAAGKQRATDRDFINTVQGTEFASRRPIKKLR